MRRRFRRMILRRLLPPRDVTIDPSLVRAFASGHLKGQGQLPDSSYYLGILFGVRSLYDAIRDGKIP